MIKGEFCRLIIIFMYSGKHFTERVSDFMGKNILQIF